MKRESKIQHDGNEVYYTACSLLVMRKHSCSKLRCQKGLIQFPLHTKLGGTLSAQTTTSGGGDGVAEVGQHRQGRKDRLQRVRPCPPPPAPPPPVGAAGWARLGTDRPASGQTDPPRGGKARLRMDSAPRRIEGYLALEKTPHPRGPWHRPTVGS